MAQAKRDDNREITGMGVTDNASLTPTNLILDPSTKRAKLTITAATLTATVNPTGKRDANRNAVVYGVTDDANQTVVPIGMDSSGFIRCDITIE